MDDPIASMQLDAEREHLVLRGADGWRLRLPFSLGVLEANERLARFAAMYTGIAPALEEARELPPCVLIARKHGLLATVPLIRRELGRPN